MGPHALGLLDRSILGVSADLRQMALVIILLKAGLSLDVKSLKRVGRPAFLMTFVPASCEILAFVLLAPPMLGLSHIEAAVMGSVLAAVSPAVVVPKMVALTEQGYGVKKGIPQMILAGASMDDVFVIVLFTSFVGLAFRVLGVAFCMIGTTLTKKERLFCMIAYLPKATVQAAIGSVPLAMGLACGQLVLTVAVVAILITAPLGAVGMQCTYKRLLSKE